MSAPVKRYLVNRGELLGAHDLKPASIYRLVDEDDYERLEQGRDAIKAASLMLGRDLADALKQVEAMRLDANLYRQWFNAVQDLSPQYLEQADYQAAGRLLESLGLPTPSSVSAGAVQAQPEETTNAN